MALSLCDRTLRVFHDKTPGYAYLYGTLETKVLYPDKTGFSLQHLSTATLALPRYWFLQIPSLTYSESCLLPSWLYGILGCTVTRRKLRFGMWAKDRAVLES